jgi:hypothetical protein
MNPARTVTIPSPPVSKAPSVSATGDDTTMRNSREKEMSKSDPSNEPPPTDDRGRKRSFMILKPQSLQSTFTRMQENEPADKPKDGRVQSDTPADAKHANLANRQPEVPDIDYGAANGAAAADTCSSAVEDPNTYIGVAADVTDSSGRHVLMTPQQLESRLGTEPAFRRAGAGAGVPPLSFAALSAFAPTPGSGAETSPGGGDMDSSSASERDLLRDLRQVCVYIYIYIYIYIYSSSASERETCAR